MEFCAHLRELGLHLAWSVLCMVSQISVSSYVQLLGCVWKSWPEIIFLPHLPQSLWALEGCEVYTSHLGLAIQLFSACWPVEHLLMAIYWKKLMLRRLRNPYVQLLKDGKALTWVFSWGSQPCYSCSTFPTQSPEQAKDTCLHLLCTKLVSTFVLWCFERRANQDTRDLIWTVWLGERLHPLALTSQLSNSLQDNCDWNEFALSVARWTQINTWALSEMTGLASEHSAAFTAWPHFGLWE